MPNDIDVKCILIPKVVAPEKRCEKEKIGKFFKVKKRQSRGKNLGLQKKDLVPKRVRKFRMAKKGVVLKRAFLLNARVSKVKKRVGRD